MKPRKPHKRSLKATVVKMLGIYKGGLNAYELSHLIKTDYPHVDTSVKTIRETLSALIKDDNVTNLGKECCPTCYASQTLYKLKRNRLSIR